MVLYLSPLPSPDMRKAVQLETEGGKGKKEGGGKIDRNAIPTPPSLPERQIEKGLKRGERLRCSFPPYQEAQGRGKKTGKKKGKGRCRNYL